MIVSAFLVQNLSLVTLLGLEIGRTKFHSEDWISHQIGLLTPETGLTLKVDEKRAAALPS